MQFSFSKLTNAAGFNVDRSRWTRTGETALIVSTVSWRNTTSVVCVTLVDVCIITYQLTELAPIVINRVYIRGVAKRFRNRATPTSLRCL